MCHHERPIAASRRLIGHTPGHDINKLLVSVHSTYATLPKSGDYFSHTTTDRVVNVIETSKLDYSSYKIHLAIYKSEHFIIITIKICVCLSLKRTLYIYI